MYTMFVVLIFHVSLLSFIREFGIHLVNLLVERSNKNLIKFFRLKKLFAIRIVAKLQQLFMLCALKDLNLLTLPMLYVLEAATYCMYKTSLTRYRGILKYGTRLNCSAQNGSTVCEKLTSQGSI